MKIIRIFIPKPVTKSNNRIFYRKYLNKKKTYIYIQIENYIRDFNHFEKNRRYCYKRISLLVRYKRWRCDRKMFAYIRFQSKLPPNVFRWIYLRYRESIHRETLGNMILSGIKWILLQDQTRTHPSDRPTVLFILWTYLEKTFSWKKKGRKEKKEIKLWFERVERGY